MKTRILLIAAALGCGVANSFSFGVNQLTIGDIVRAFPAPFSGMHVTDDDVDESTVRITLVDVPEMKRWQLRFNGAQSGSQDLTDGHDIALGVRFSLDLFAFPKGSAQEAKCLIVQGLDVSNVVFDYVGNTIHLELEPVAPARTASYATGLYEAACGIDIVYSGEPGGFDYGPPIIVTDAFLDDVHPAAHPSTEQLNGKGIRIDGVNTEPVNLHYLFGSRYLSQHGLASDSLRAYRDGVASPDGLTFSGPIAVETSIDLGDPGEVFFAYDVVNSGFSAVDIQLGLLPEALRITGIVKESDGYRIQWNGAPGTTYSIETRDTMNGVTDFPVTGLDVSEFLDTAPTGASGMRVYRVKED
jgi:hypothetical protein